MFKGIHKEYLTGLIVGVLLMAILWGVSDTKQKYKQYKMNLKCVQGELYEEVRTNMFVKSHLECFEQRTLTP